MEGVYILKTKDVIRGGYHRLFIAGDENAKEYYFDTVKSGDWAELWDTKVEEFGVITEDTKLLG